MYKKLIDIVVTFCFFASFLFPPPRSPLFSFKAEEATSAAAPEQSSVADGCVCIDRFMGPRGGDSGESEGREGPFSGREHEREDAPPWTEQLQLEDTNDRLGFSLQSCPASLYSSPKQFKTSLFFSCYCLL